MVWPISILDWLIRWSDVVGVVGSLLLSVVSIVLTGALVYFYREMRNVQAAQTEIQDKQTELLEIQTEISRANHEPELRITDVSFGERDTIELEIENIGNGIAKDLKLACVVVAENEHFEVGTSSTPLTEIGDSLSDQRRSLTPDSSGEFTGHVLPTLSSERFSNTRSWFSVATEKLHYTGTQTLVVEVQVRYQNILGDDRLEPVTRASVLLTTGKSIERALKEPMDAMAQDLSSQGPSLLASRHLGQDGPFPGADSVRVDYTTIDKLPMGYELNLDIETSPEVACEIEREQTVIETVDEAGEETIRFGGDKHDHLEHGDLVHVFAVRGESRWQIDVIGAGDQSPEGLPNAEAIQRRLQLM